MVFFNACPEKCDIPPPHFQQFGVIENGGTTLCRKQAAEKQRFSMALPEAGLEMFCNGFNAGVIADYCRRAVASSSAR